MFAQQQFGPKGAAATIESFLRIHSGPKGFAGHLTTFECAVHGFGSQDQLRKIRAALARPRLYPLGAARLRRRGGLFWEPRVGAWAVPFPGSDAAVVRTSQATLVEREQPPVQVRWRLPLW